MAFANAVICSASLSEGSLKRLSVVAVTVSVGVSNYGAVSTSLQNKAWSRNTVFILSLSTDGVSLERLQRYVMSSYSLMGSSSSSSIVATVSNDISTSSVENVSQRIWNTYIGELTIRIVNNNFDFLLVCTVGESQASHRVASFLAFALALQWTGLCGSGGKVLCCDNDERRKDS